MGGIGSGSWTRPNEPKPTAENHLALDVGDWRRNGIIEAGRDVSGRYAWLDMEGREVASVGFDCRAGEVDGRVELTIGGVRHRVELATIKPGLGGRRWFFVCGDCGRKFSKLRLAAGSFRCRRCHGMTYRSVRNAHKHERLRRSFGKLVEKHPDGDLRRLRPAELDLLIGATGTAHSSEWNWEDSAILIGQKN